MLDLPSNSPESSMTFFKPVMKDLFQRIRDDGEPGETPGFERAESGQVDRFRIHENFYYRINPSLDFD